MFDERTRSGWSVLVRGRLAVASDSPLASLEPWAPGPHERRMVVAITSVTGRLLRGPVPSPDPAPGGYL